MVDVDSERQREIDALSILASQAHHGLPLVVVTRKLNEQFARAHFHALLNPEIERPLARTASIAEGPGSRTSTLKL